ncbi:unnamed protein product [Amoebophrya sp. A120]|nr:unnamed protein product [Amoebophrya sp. A120]|eukprot:GSA120T00008473001.1
MLINIVGIIYILAGILPCMMLFIAKDDMCDGSSDNPDCPHPSVSDVEHQSDLRPAIIATSVLRLFVCGGILLVSGVNTEMTSNSPIKPTTRSSAGASADDTEISCDCVACKPLFIVGWAICDIVQLMVSNKSNATMHNVFSQLAQICLVLSHWIHIRGVFSSGGGSGSGSGMKTSPESSTSVGGMNGSPEIAFACGMLAVLAMMALIGVGFFLMANLGNTSANVAWSNAQWMAVGMQAGLFFCTGFTIL